MSYSLRFRPEPVADVHAAFVWYEGAATGLGHEFLRAYFAAGAAIQREPLIHLEVYRDFHRVEGWTVVVFLLIHGARSPARVRRAWRERREPLD